MHTTLRAARLFGFLALTFAAFLTVVPVHQVHADAGMVPSGGSASTLKASPAGKALCPMVVRDSTGAVQATIDCNGNYGNRYGLLLGSGILATGGSIFPGVSLSNNKVTSLANGTAATDAAAWGQVYETVGGTITATSTPNLAADYIVPAGGAKVVTFIYAQNGASAGAGCSETFSVFDFTTTTALCTSSAFTSCAGAGNGTVACTATLVAGHEIQLVATTNGGFTTKPGYYLAMQLTH